MLQIFRMSVGRVLRGDPRFLLRHCVSAVGIARCASRRVSSMDSKWERICTVDGNKEEEFVFVDCTGEEKGGGAVRDLVVTLCCCRKVMLQDCVISFRKLNEMSRYVMLC